MALGGPAMNDRLRREEIYSPDLAPYVDMLAIVEEQVDEARRMAHAG